ncbi:hypothetical protein J7F03_05440 [Streptomyces sp. ISL-43]|uniref:DUF6461 domain-containing protein n=1 Tax=Streptomyces sp. ISL-43 TaxID=2819183 RepID=UPI001BE670A3|nr:DUF6461 domain-containing protein [Streptomyces sp. ISL-43]MBT2446533.1 hypothetical protein [Streptomyces sp. ISL-43]
MTAKLLPNSQLYDTGYCVIFARNVSAVELLSRVSREGIQPISLSRMAAEAIRMLGEDEDAEDGAVPEADMEDLERAGILVNDGPLLRAGTHGNWSFVVEPEGPYLAGPGLLEAASRGTAALCVQLSEAMAAWISYAEDGEVLSSFDPLFPDRDYGARPEILESLTGYRSAIDSGDPAFAYESALRKIQQELRCAVPQEVDADLLPAIRVHGGY